LLKNVVKNRLNRKLAGLSPVQYRTQTSQTAA